MDHQLVMVVAENMEIHQAFASALGECELAPIVASTVNEAIGILSHHPIFLVFCSDELSSDGISALIRQEYRFGKRVPVVVISRQDDWYRYLAFLHDGAFDCVLYPVSGRQVDQVLRNVSSLSTSEDDERPRHFGIRPRSVHALSEFSQG
jgi:DNA-binding NtrC family response regulator